MEMEDDSVVVSVCNISYLEGDYDCSIGISILPVLEEWFHYTVTWIADEPINKSCLNRCRGRLDYNSWNREQYNDIPNTFSVDFNSLKAAIESFGGKDFAIYNHPIDEDSYTAERFCRYIFDYLSLSVDIEGLSLNYRNIYYCSDVDLEFETTLLAATTYEEIHTLYDNSEVVYYRIGRYKVKLTNCTLSDSIVSNFRKVNGKMVSPKLISVLKFGKPLCNTANINNNNKLVPIQPVGISDSAVILLILFLGVIILIVVVIYERMKYSNDSDDD